MVEKVKAPAGIVIIMAGRFITFSKNAPINFIEASADTPFFQIGETKYGRPILVRGFEADMDFADIVKLLMVSFDSTLKANLSVGLPLDLMLYKTGDFAPFHERRITSEDPYFESISESWSDALRAAFHSQPDYELDA